MATAQQRLDNARDAYDRLMTGKAVRVFVDQNGERIEYAVANAARLAQYITQLEAQNGATTCGPMGVIS